jgi:hypothetical protein
MNYRAAQHIAGGIFLLAAVVLSVYYTIILANEIATHNSSHREAIRYAVWGTAAYGGTIPYNQTHYTCAAQHCYVVVQIGRHVVCHLQSDEPIDFRQHPSILPDCTLFAYKEAFLCITVGIMSLYAVLVTSVYIWHAYLFWKS